METGISKNPPSNLNRPSLSPNSSTTDATAITATTGCSAITTLNHNTPSPSIPPTEMKTYTADPSSLLTAFSGSENGDDSHCNSLSDFVFTPEQYFSLLHVDLKEGAYINGMDSDSANTSVKNPSN